MADQLGTFVPTYAAKTEFKDNIKIGVVLSTELFKNNQGEFVLL